MIKDFLTRITFDEEVYSKEYGTKTLYFEGPIGLLDGKYPDAESSEISVEVPIDIDEENYTISEIQVMLSPTKYVDGSYLDYDWQEVHATIEEITELIKLCPVTDPLSLRRLNSGE